MSLPPQIQELVGFSQRLRRYTSLNHLAQAARATLTKQTHLQQVCAPLPTLWPRPGLAWPDPGPGLPIPPHTCSVFGRGSRHCNRLLACCSSAAALTLTLTLTLTLNTNPRMHCNLLHTCHAPCHHPAAINPDGAGLSAHRLCHRAAAGVLGLRWMRP